MTSRKMMKLSTGGTVFRAPSYFVWNHRKHASSSPRSSPRRMATNTNMNHAQDQEVRAGDSTGPSLHKMRSPRSRAATVAGTDNHSTDTKSSGVSGDSGGLVNISPKHKDPDRIKKDREREERVRQARERLEGERKKKLIELQEQQRQAQENREKQLEMRRKKIEDLRRRDVERRAEVEKRRREKENAERSRRETLLQKAEERVARYEAWKRSGQKGPPPGGVMPTAKQLSVSTSVLYHKRNSEFSSLGVLNVSNRPDSLLALNTIPEGRRSVLAPYAPPPSRPRSVMTLSASSMGSGTDSTARVKLRENKSPRKPRPASVGTSMPSFVSLDTPKASQRSKSTDRLARERSRARGTMSSNRGEKEEEKKADKSGIKMSRRTLDRLSTPRQLASIIGDGKDSTPKRDGNVARKSSIREKTPKEAPAKSQQSTPAAPSGGVPASSAADNSSSIPATSEAAPITPATRTPTRTPVRVVSPTPAGDEDGGSSTPQSRSNPSIMERSTGDITAEEYKAKLAEKRRQAREKAEREAEEERKRQEELQRQEEERERQEEEEQRRRDEEAMRLVEEARKAEEERLRKAIEAEEARKAEEAARLEQERLAKEEAERKAKEEAERMEVERQEKARREEEERLERKKRLEMIMKRVKTDSPGEGPRDTPKSVTSSPSRSVTSTASSDTSPTDPENKTVMAMIAQAQGPATGVNSSAPVASEQSGASTSPEDVTVNVESTPKDTEGSQQSAEISLSPTVAPSPGPSVDQEAASVQGTEQKETLEMMEKSDPADVVKEESFTLSASSTTTRVGTPENGEDKPKFKSPLLQKLVEGKEDASISAGGGTKFKSPLLQNLLGKTRGARMGIAQDHSVSTPNLSQVNRSADGQGDGASQASLLSDAMSTSMIDVGVSESGPEEVVNSGEVKEMDTTDDSSSSHSSPTRASVNTVVSYDNGESASISVSASSQQDDSSVIQPEPMDISRSMESSAAPAVMATSAASLWSEQDSGVSCGSDDLRNAAPSSSLQLSMNGHGPALAAHNQGLEDSSISMRSVESVTSSITDSAAGSVFSSVSSLPQGHPCGDKDFEEVIDLPVNNKSNTPSTATTTVTLLDNSADLFNFSHLEGQSEESTTVPPPINAFEDRRQDVPDLLS